MSAEPSVHVLLIEDNDGDARLLKEMLKEPGSIKTELTHLSNMTDALKYLATGRANVIVLDLGLPDVAGIDAVRKVRSVATKIALLVLTGLDDDTVATQALTEGAQDYLVKAQIDSRGLLRALRYAIERQRMQVESDEIRKLQLRLRNEFISTVSHELRTPLTSIRGALGLINEEAMSELPEQAKTMVQIAYKNSERLVRIINDILDMEKIDSGGLEIRIQAVEVGEFLRQAVAVNDTYGIKYHVRFVLEPPTPGLLVAADPDRLMQVMANLLSNAAKFSPAGSEVLVRASERDLSVHIEVQDYGTGIPEAFRGRVFEKFSQADSSASRRFEGTGLGLSITRRLVEAMSGTIGFDTVVDKGTTFFFELPRAGEAVQTRKVPPSSDTAICRALVLEGEPANAGTQAAIPRILHVEDDVDLSQVIAAALAGRAVVVFARTLKEAEALLQEQTFSLLLLDLTLPDGDAIGLLERLPELIGATTPVVILSSREPPMEVKERVAASLIKSRVSEPHIVKTVLSLLG